MVKFFIYISIGGILCFIYKYIASEFDETDETKSEFDIFADTVIAIATGALWPAVAAFSFGILFAKRRRRKRKR